LSNANHTGNLLPETSQPQPGDIRAVGLVARSDWSEMSEREHFVQFYESDEFLLNSLRGFIGTGLSTGEACIVVATSAHREGLEQRLQEDGVNVAAARASGQFVALDASELLTQFMVDGVPEPERFAAVIGNLIVRVAQGPRGVRVFGEMVAVLWAAGNHDGALRLEALWNGLRTSHSFSLFCAYPLNALGGEALVEPLSQVCGAHAHIILSESYSSLENPVDRLRAVIQLQQKARSLEAEIAERKKIEDDLRAVKDELEVQVKDLCRLHEMSVGLTSTLDIESVLNEVLRAALAVQGTDLGLLSLCDPEPDILKVKVHSGFDEEFLRQLEWVPPGGSACGSCYVQRQRVVIEDVEADTLLASAREAARAAGFRACNSTPLITRSGHIIGVLSAHFRQPHRPSEREMRLMDLYARMAADIIENARLHHQAQQELEARQQALVREQVARAEAESANRMKDEFLATASHELRTPLNAIIGWASMLSRGGLDQAMVAHGIKTIERNAKAQAQLIEDILDVSRVITGKLCLNIGPVDAASVINAALDSVQLAADSKGIQLEVTLDPSARHILGDPSRLQQIVWNLLSNAIKFTPSEGRVAVRLEHANARAQITISDTGEGIRADFLPFIFDRFRQADGTSTRRHGGLGLGLAIVRHLVELHGGTVHADSPGEGQGATFIIQLPLAVANERAKTQRRSTGSLWPGVEAMTPTNPAPSLDDVRVLLVDDDEFTLQLLTIALTECGAKVQSASSVAEAMDILTWYQPDVLVSDLAMPYEDGHSLITKLRAQEAAGDRHIPAVALTAYVRVEDRARALSAGFNMFVAKPVEPNELITAIATLAEVNTAKAGQA
jgi:signal transduction histidine kinase/ActR/RegA family two-component response regulator